MFNKNNFFKSNFKKSKIFNKNLSKTKKVFKTLLEDLKNNKIPLLQSFEKDYEFSFSQEIIKKFSRYENIIIIGMGGSILGSKSIFSFFKKKIRKRVFFFDNLDFNLNLDYKKIENLKNSCFIVISKSGNTLETITNFKTIFSKKIFKKKLIVITELKDNKLMNIADKYDAEIIEHKEFIVGRYSVLSESAMFPSALMGLNLSKFKNLKILIKNKNFVSSLIQNVASIYSLSQKHINNSVILNYDSNLKDLSYWYQQLNAESLGKKSKGINPIVAFGPKDQHSLLQLYLEGPKDKFFTFLNSSGKKIKGRNKINSVIQAQCLAVKNVFKAKKIPFREITFYKKTEKELGEVFTFFVLETILLSKLTKVNPFNQPAVELVKNETKRILR
tara:strand:+ start:1225 stop:2388 length:1164 start_codon:yes stop_codon:yes gene_type:complete